MKKRILSLLCAVAMLTAAGCGSSSEASSAAASAETSSEENEAQEVESEAAEAESETTEAESEPAEAGEKPVLTWGTSNSGNVLISIAHEKGYFDEAGVEINMVNAGGAADALAALAGEQLDIISGFGTNNPLNAIANGEDFMIVGGYMLKGTYLVAKKGTEWTGVESLVGKRFGANTNLTPVTYAAIQAGIDPMTEIEWVKYANNSERLAAVAAGEIDYAQLDGSLLYTVGNMDDIEIVCYLDELQPNYGCCRVVMRSDYVNENPETVKNVLKGVLQSECYLQDHRDECVTLLAKELNVEEDYVAAYLKNEEYVTSVDPVRNQVKVTWETMMATDLLPEGSENMNIDDHINIDLYKQALDELLEESKGTEDEAFYQEREEFFQANNY